MYFIVHAAFVRIELMMMLMMMMIDRSMFLISSIQSKVSNSALKLCC